MKFLINFKITGWDIPKYHCEVTSTNQTKAIKKAKKIVDEYIHKTEMKKSIKELQRPAIYINLMSVNILEVSKYDMMHI